MPGCFFRLWVELMRKTVVVAILVFAVFVLAFSDKLKNKEKIMEARKYAAAPAAGGMMRISVNGHTFDMDVYEYPDKAGEIPAGGMKYPEAEAACKSVGKRLCTAGEWMEACRGKEMYLYSFAKEKKGFDDNKKACNNIHSSRSAAPSGSFRKCVSQDGLYDMSGNLWEWVEKSGTGAWPAKGGSYRDGELSHRCEFTFKLFESQAEKLSFDNFGVRCCRDAR